MKPRVELRIDELVLHGVAPGDRTAIARAVEEELGRLLADQGLPAVAHDASRVDGGVLPAIAASGPGEMGRHIARALHSSLGDRSGDGGKR